MVLHPNAETFYADICLLNGKLGSKMSDMEALEFESKVLVSVIVVRLFWILIMPPDRHITTVAS